MSPEGTCRTSRPITNMKSSRVVFPQCELATNKQKQKPDQEDPSELEIQLCTHRGSYVPSLGSGHHHKL